MIFGLKKSSKLEVNHWAYDAFLFLLLLIKIVFVLSTLKNRVNANDRNQYIMILTKNMFTVGICLLLLYLFHPYTKNPALVWRDTKVFLFMFAILTLFEIDWNVFISPMSSVISDVDGKNNTSRTLSSSISSLESTMHGALCNRNSVYTDPIFNVPPLRDFCSNSQIKSENIAAVLIILAVIIFGLIHKPTSGKNHYETTAILIILATIAFGIWFQ